MSFQTVERPRAETLHEAIEDLLAQDERGIVRDGTLRVPQLLPAMKTGWRSLPRGLPQSYFDLELASPGAGVGTLMGYLLRPVLTPLTMRPQPLSPPARLGLAAGATELAALGIVALARRKRGAPRGAEEKTG